jgi:hypothetical protein
MLVVAASPVQTWTTQLGAARVNEVAHAGAVGALEVRVLIPADEFLA